MEVLKDSELAPPMDTTNLQLHMEKKKSLCKGPEYWMKRCHSKG